MIKLAVVTAVASVLSFAGCSGASPSGEVTDPTEAPPQAAPIAPGASGALGGPGTPGASADKGGSTPSSAATPGAAQGMPAPAAGAPANGCQMEVEPNDTRAQAQVVTLVDAKSATVCGALGKASDEDWFVVHVTGADADLTVAMTTSDAVTVQLISPSGDAYEESHGAGANGRQADSIDAWDGPGDYVIHVKSATHAQVSYSLQLTVEQ